MNRGFLHAHGDKPEPPWYPSAESRRRLQLAERRRERRVYAKLKVWCEGDDFTLLAHTQDLSAEGLFVRTSSVPPGNDRFRISIEELGTVADVELRWIRRDASATRSGMGLVITGFHQGRGEYESFVEQKGTSRSGEYSFRIERGEKGKS